MSRAAPHSREPETREGMGLAGAEPGVSRVPRALGRAGGGQQLREGPAAASRCLGLWLSPRDLGFLLKRPRFRRYEVAPRSDSEESSEEEEEEVRSFPGAGRPFSVGVSIPGQVAVAAWPGVLGTSRGTSRPAPWRPVLSASLAARRSASLLG